MTDSFVSVETCPECGQIVETTGGYFAVHRYPDPPNQHRLVGARCLNSGGLASVASIPEDTDG